MQEKPKEIMVIPDNSGIKFFDRDIENINDLVFEEKGEQEFQKNGVFRNCQIGYDHSDCLFEVKQKNERAATASISFTRRKHYRKYIAKR